MKKTILSAFGVLVALTSAAFAQNGGLTLEEFEELENSDVYSLMIEPRSLNFTSDDLRAAVNAAKDARTNLMISKVDPTKTYDVILQVGHFPRTKGSTGAQGKLINEQEGAAYVAALLSEELNAAGIHHIIVGADSYKSGKKRDSQHFFRTKIFLSLHLDGSENPCRVGPSLGYNPKFGKTSMQYLGVALAIALKLDAYDFMRDNYTKNLSHFYSYRHSDTQIAEGIVEMSELSCPSDEERFLMAANTIATNLAVGISFMLEGRR